jgi:uncharacterized RDD family membrane protein YckC
MEEEMIRLCRELDTAIKEERLRPEDVEERLRLLRPLDRAMAFLPVPPQIKPDSPARKIATLLWFKRNPEKADLDFLLRHLKDDEPAVRVVAADALVATLDPPHQDWSNPNFSYIVRQTLLDWHAKESSPLVAFELSRLMERVGRLSRPRRPAPRRLLVNPYIAGLPVRGGDKFFGRQDILNEIGETLGKKSGVKSIILYGARRTGKTSLLFRIKDGVLGQSVFPVYLDMQSLAGTSVQSFLRSLVNIVQNELWERKHIASENLPRLQGEITFSFLQEFFQSALNILNTELLFLLLDEYEVLQSYFLDRDIARQLQFLLETQPKLFVIFAGSQKVEALKEKNFLFLLDISRYIKISFLKLDEARRLIIGQSQGRLEFAQGVPEQILELSAGHPFYTQLICQSIFDMLEGHGTVEASHVEQAVEQFLQNPSPHLILTWKALALDQKVVAATLADQQSERERWVEPEQVVKHLHSEKYPIHLGRGEVQEALGVLREIDWIEKREGVRRYRFTMELVRQWIAEYHSIWDLLEEHRRGVLSQAAGFGRRTCAGLIDLVVMMALWLVLWALARTAEINHWYLELGLQLFGLWAFFATLMVTWRSTVGIRCVNLRVLSEAGVPLQRMRAMLFGTLRHLPNLPLAAAAYFALQEKFPLGGLSITIVLALFAVLIAVFNILIIYFDKNGQGLYDKMAHTIIVYEK